MIPTSPDKKYDVVLFLAEVTRVREWHDSKMPLFFVACYSFLMISGEPYAALLGKTASFLVFCASYLAFNYSFNDYCDRACDRVAGKVKMIADCSPTTVMLILAVPTALALAVVIPGINTPSGIVILAICWFSGMTYSAPPLRLKERGVIGALAASVAQRTLPMMVGMSIFGIFAPELYALCLLSILVGLRWILIHQLLDCDNDAAAGVSTFVRNIGRKNALMLLKGVVFPGELVALTWWLILMSQRNTWFLLVVPLYLVWLKLQFHIWKGRGPAYTWDRYNRPQLGDLYTAILPLSTGAALYLQKGCFLPVFLLQLLLFYPYLNGQFTAVVKQLRKTA